MIGYDDYDDDDGDIYELPTITQCAAVCGNLLVPIYCGNVLYASTSKKAKKAPQSAD